MPTRDLKTPDALAAAARDISRHIAGLADELLHLHHNRAGDTEGLVDRQLDKLRDQIALLTAVVNDLARAEHQA
ncbi:MAG TPA: hypothetical protein VMB71_12435 [Acetobacteraceae bacterium]|nr:hypothetical protein [Acetobacteraceae bacterium]